MRHAKRPSPRRKLQLCRQCACELSFRELQECNGLCFVCARNRADRLAAQEAFDGTR